MKYRTLLVLSVCLCAAISCKNAQFYAEEGVKHLDAGRNVTALTAFDKALDRDPENALALYGKGRILLLQPLTRDIGKQMLTTSLPSLEGSQSEKACILLADALFRDKIIKKAVETLAGCRKRGVTSVRLYNNLAQYHLQLKEGEKAVELLALGVKDFADDADAHYNYGLFLATRSKKYKAAREHFGKSNELKPDKPDTLFNLVRTHYLLKDRAAALQMLDKLAALPDAKPVAAKLADVRKRIEKGRWDARTSKL